MKKLIFILLALFCAISVTQSHRHHHERGKSCHYPKIWSRSANSCQCPASRSQLNCINWEEFDEDSCSCYCPFSRYKCPKNKRWSYSNCHCQCKNKEPKEGCLNRRWSKSQCKCVPLDTTTKLTTVETSSSSSTVSTAGTSIDSSTLATSTIENTTLKSLTTTQYVNDTSSSLTLSLTDGTTETSRTLMTSSLTDSTAASTLTDSSTTASSISEVTNSTTTQYISDTSSTLTVPLTEDTTLSTSETSNILTVSTKTSTVTSSPNNESLTTQYPTCSYGLEIYNEDTEVIDGILANTDFNIVYVAYTTINGVIIPGGLETSNTMNRGFYYSQNGQIFHNIHNNVNYLTQTPNCNCQFIPKNDPIPETGYLVTFNSDLNLFGVGSTTHYSAIFNTSMTVVGKIDVASDTLSFYSPLNAAELTTDNFTKLICSFIEATSATFATTATVSYDFASFYEEVLKSDLLLAQINETESKILELNSTFVAKLQTSASSPNISSKDNETLNQLIGILCSNTIQLNFVAFRSKRQVQGLTCEYVIKQINSVSAALAQSTALGASIQTTADQVMAAFFSNPTTQMTNDLINFISNLRAYIDALNNRQKLYRSSLDNLKTQKEFICVPVTSGCSFTRDLFYPNGTYVSSVCWYNIRGFQDDVLKNCQKINMNLFTIASVAERDSLFIASGNIWGYGKYPIVWISGKNGPNYVDSNDETSLGSFAQPKNTHLVGNCLALGSYAVPRFEIMTFNCSAQMSGFCKWINPNPIEECVSWKPYANDNAPITDGFLVGKNQAGFNIYVGQGAYLTDMAPGNIQIDSPAGLFMVHSGIENEVTSDAWYMKKQSKCSCNWIPQAVNNNVTGLVRVSNSYWIGRHIFPDNSVTIGKVYSYNNQILMNYANKSTEVTNEVNYEALQCIPTPVPKTSNCSFTRDLFNSNGSYISSVCWYTEGTQDDALKNCQKINMNLFTITSVDERNSLFIASGNYWGYGNYPSIWISGKNGPNYVDSNDVAFALGSLALPTNTYLGGKCLAIGSYGVSRFEIMTFDCAAQMSSFCKWKNPNPTIECVAWKPYLNVYSPLTDGFLVGLDQAGFNAYVGQGAYLNDMSPGKIRVGSSLGLFIASYNDERQVTTDVWYMVKRPTCTCKWVAQGVDNNVTGLVRVSNNYWVGRFVFRVGIYSIGKIYLYNNQIFMNYIDNGIAKVTSTYEALQCLSG